VDRPRLRFVSRHLPEHCAIVVIGDLWLRVRQVTVSEYSGRLVVSTARIGPRVVEYEFELVSLGANIQQLEKEVLLTLAIPEVN